jgi:cellobiose phosphorylase
MINPINHGSDPESVTEYKVEPYVIAADVYGVPLHKGRGGWTWYTGSAGWMYQLIIESFIGLKKEGNNLYFEPHVPAIWKSFSITYRFMDTTYHITINQKKNNGSIEKLLVDGIEQPTKFIPLNNDGMAHEVEIVF